MTSPLFRTQERRKIIAIKSEDSSPFDAFLGSMRVKMIKSGDERQGRKNPVNQDTIEYTLKVGEVVNMRVIPMEEEAESKYSRSRARVAERTDAPIELLERLSKDESKYVRLIVAANPTTPVKVLKEMAEEGYFDVRARIAANPSSTQELLRKLSLDEDSYVRVETARNENTPADILESLSRCEDEYVRLAVARNPSTSVTTIFHLSKEGGEIRDAVMDHSNYDWNKYLEEFISID